jgi:hypothetical protein
MLEKFTPEEIEQIKIELSFLEKNKKPTIKGDVLKSFRIEVNELLPESEQKTGYHGHRRNIIHALTALCDYSFNNYDISEQHGNIKVTMSKHIPLSIQERYKQMMYDLLDVAKKYKEAKQ